MELIGQRSQIGATEEMLMEFPTTAEGLDSINADGYGVGVWQDGAWYVWGDSRTDDTPEHITWVMTAQEYRQHAVDKKPLDPKQGIKMMQRAEKMYPGKSILGQITKESRQEAAAALGLPFSEWPEDKMSKAVNDLVMEPGVVNLVTVLHDDGCPTLTSQKDGDCTCEEPDVEVSQV